MDWFQAHLCKPSGRAARAGMIPVCEANAGTGLWRHGKDGGIKHYLMQRFSLRR